jgi:hypothetical protein
VEKVTNRRNHAREVACVGPKLAAERIWLAPTHITGERLDERLIGKPRRTFFVAVADQRLSGAADDDAPHLLAERGLADAGLAHEQHQAAISTASCFEC